jgi:predicted RNA-binding Zn-ribbon protein involved in translation (DUF1610 family)
MRAVLVSREASRALALLNGDDLSARAWQTRIKVMQEGARYSCPSCGEEIIVPVDPSGGDEQEYVEDCPVCCAPVLLSVRFEEDGEISVVARSE